MSLTKETLTQFKSELQSRRDNLARDLAAATAELIEDDAMYSDSVDQASADTDKGITVQMKNRERDVLIQIDEAIRRIEAGSFGLCESCGEEILEARMKANPSTTMCLDCRAEMENKRMRYPGRV